MACAVTKMNVTLPSLRTLFPASSLPSPSPSPTTEEDISKGKDQFAMPRLPSPLTSPNYSHNRRISTSSIDSDASAPSLVYSSSPPSPPPAREPSPPSFLLVPCEMNVANALVVVSLSSSTTSTRTSPSSSSASPVFRLCKPSEAKATLLIGPAISAHVRRRAATGDRRMHPYRIVRERRE